MRLHPGSGSIGYATPWFGNAMRVSGTERVRTTAQKSRQKDDHVEVHAVVLDINMTAIIAVAEAG